MAEALKDIFFQKPYFEKLENLLKKEYPAFNKKLFESNAFTKEWKEKALKEKMHIVTIALGKTLPKNFKEAVTILKKVEKDINGFEHLVFSDFVGTYGLDHFKESMSAFEVFTRSTSELAIRPFIQKYPRESMAQMLLWSKHPKDYVRRLSSEGCRPRLPWGMRLHLFIKDPKPIFPILENLKNDSSKSVRLSVSNNLNDISKDHPELVLKIAKQWKGKSKDIDDLLKHALRGLLKKGNVEAMQLFGFNDTKGITVKNLKIEPKEIKVGGKGYFSLEVHSKEAKLIRLEYQVIYAREKGRQSQKVFQIQEREFKKGETKEYKRKLNFADRTIRKHYPGEHRLILIVNGKRVGERKFKLI